MTKNNTIIIVSGLPRSGTSMAMKILEAGGVELLIDNIRKADIDNPEGYYEFEKVKRLERDSSWLKEADGKALKVISMLLRYLPRNKDYKVIFMLRKMEETVASQKKMLEYRRKEDNIADDEMSKLLKQHMINIKDWLIKQNNFDVMHVWYHELINNPERNIKKIERFLGDSLNIDNMIKVIDPMLYRNKF